MNECMGNTVVFRHHKYVALPPPVPVLAKASLSSTPIDPPSVQSVVVMTPSIANMSRTLIKPQSALQAWMLLHLGAMHASPSVL